MAEKTQRRKPALLDESKLKEYALRLVSARGYSEGELKAKLRRKAAVKGDVERVAALLHRYGYVDDRKFAESFAMARKEGGGHGEQRVLKDLLRRKVPMEIARGAVEEAFRESDEKELVRTFLARKFRKVNLGEYLKEPKNLASVYRKLRYAGFGGRASIDVLRAYSERAEELTDGEPE